MTLRVWAYCTAKNAASVQAAVGVEPWTSPPCTQETLDNKGMEGQDLLYFRLHGLKSVPSMWWGETRLGGLVPAFARDNLKGIDLGGAVVVLANCYGNSSPLVKSLLLSGASAVIAGPGKNYAAKRGRVIGVDTLAKWVRIGLGSGLGPQAALSLAKSRLLLTSWRAVDRDALEFRLHRG